MAHRRVEHALYLLKMWLDPGLVMQRQPFKHPILAGFPQFLLLIAFDKQPEQIR